MKTVNRLFDAHRRANAIAKPVVETVEVAKCEAWLAGRRPTIVCLGEKQYDILEKYSEAVEEFVAPSTACGLRIIWTNDPDYVGVFEERKGGWV